MTTIAELKQQRDASYAAATDGLIGDEYARFSRAALERPEQLREYRAAVARLEFALLGTRYAGADAEHF